MSGTSSKTVGRKPVKRPRGPARLTMLLAATKTFGKTFAWTDRMQTAMGTLTTQLPAPAMAPETKATDPGLFSGKTS